MRAAEFLVTIRSPAARRLIAAAQAHRPAARITSVGSTLPWLRAIPMSFMHRSVRLIGIARADAGVRRVVSLAPGLRITAGAPGHSWPAPLAGRLHPAPPPGEGLGLPAAGTIPKTGTTKGSRLIRTILTGFSLTLSISGWPIVLALPGMTSVVVTPA